MSTERREKLIETLRSVLMRMRWDSQDGFPGVGANGLYAGFVTAGLPQASPEEIDDLMELAGICPGPIVTKGLCKDCRHATPSGHERGYAIPCIDCGRPQMSNFVPLGHAVRKEKECDCRNCNNRRENPKKYREMEKRQ